MEYAPTKTAPTAEAMPEVKSRDAKRSLGQFFTPESTADFMASLFSSSKRISVLDPGAGLGVLSEALVSALSRSGSKEIRLDLYEIDGDASRGLKSNIEVLRENMLAKGVAVVPRYSTQDFIQAACDHLHTDGSPRYDRVILNPPYKKVHSSSSHRKVLRSVGIETVNLYSAFLWLSILLTKPNGEIVAIVPRSFCNGPYYKPFRDFLLSNTRINRIHVFGSRSKVFDSENVLQESVIFHLTKTAPATSGSVTVSTSEDSSFSDLRNETHAFSDIVSPFDGERFIHIPQGQSAKDLSRALRDVVSLEDLNVTVSTGPVVDYRVKDHLKQRASGHGAPLIYPANIHAGRVRWPISGKKPIAIEVNEATERQLLPTGFYCLVKRFTSKEEKRRIVAAVLDPLDFDLVGIENHLNYFHYNKRGLDEPVAHGIAAYLNSTAVDQYFRQFSGHTQVNVTDLRSLPYPPLEILRILGKKMLLGKIAGQEALDTLVMKHI